MSPRFDRRRDQGQGSGAAGSRPARPGRPDARGGSRRPFAPRGEWRPERGEGGDRPSRPERGDRPSFGRRPERSDRFGGERTERFGDRSRPERRFDGARRPGGDRPRFERSGGERWNSDRSAGERAGSERSSFDRGGADRAASGRPGSDRPGSERRGGDFRPRFEGARGSGSRTERRPGRPQGQGRFGARPSAFQERRVERRPLIVDAPSGEAERFNAGPADDLIWGRHAAQAALESDRPIHRIWCTPEMRFQSRFMQLLREAKAGGVLVEEVTWARLGQLTDGAVHQGIVLQAAAADTLDLGSLIDGCRSIGEPPLLMALDGVTDPHNLGAIVRSAEALGAHGLVLPQRRSAGLTGSVAKVAAGALEHLPVARVVNLNRSLETLKEEGYRVIGLAGEAGVALSEADLDGPLVIVTGSEGSGLSMLTRKHCDQLVRIPLRGATPSLNASVATAMVLYEVARRGWMKQITGSAPAPRIVRPQIPSAPLMASAPTAAAPAEAPAAASTDVQDHDDDGFDLFSPEDTEAAQQLVDQVVSELQTSHLATHSETHSDAGSSPDSTPAGFSGDIQL